MKYYIYDVNKSLNGVLFTNYIMELELDFFSNLFYISFPLNELNGGAQARRCNPALMFVYHHCQCLGIVTHCNIGKKNAMHYISLCKLYISTETHQS